MSAEYKIYNFKCSLQIIYNFLKGLITHTHYSWQILFTLLKSSQIFISKFHILALLPSPIQIQNLSNSLDHIYHLVSPFSLPNLFFDGFAPHNDWVCQQIVTKSTGNSVVDGGLGLGTLEIFQLWLPCALCLSVQDGVLGVLSILTLQISIPVLFYIFTNGAIWSPSTFFFCLLWCHSSMGDWCFMGMCFDFIVGWM